MNVSSCPNAFPAGGRDGLQIFGLRPVPALAALGLVLAGAWVLASTIGNHEAPAQADMATPPATASGLATPVTLPGAGAASHRSVAAAPDQAGQSRYPAVVQQPPGTVTGGGSSRRAASANPAAPAVADPAATMYLTIVGDQTYVTYGPAGQRTPRVNDLVVGRGAGGRAEGAGTADAAGGRTSAGDGAGVQLATDDSNPADLGPEPQQCPRTLPPGSTQADADQLTALYSCRYLSGCRIGDGACTFFYQGRG